MDARFRGHDGGASKTESISMTGYGKDGIYRHDGLWDRRNLQE